MKQWHFFDKVYRRWVVLFIGSLDEFRDEMKSIGYKDMDFIIEAKGMTIELNPESNDLKNDATVIWLNGYETTTLIHEITHLVMMLFDQVGVPISRDNTEAFAFYSEYWFSQIQKARRKWPNGNTPKDAKQ